MRFVYLLFFALALSVPVFGYIDPGTGSMLFSLLSGAAVTVFFFVKNLLLRFKGGGFFAKRAGEGEGARGLVIYSEGRQYWNVFKPVVEELARRGIPWAYYSSDGEDPGLRFEAPPLVEKKFIGAGSAAYRFLNFLEADLCLMTTPSLDVFQLKRSPAVRHYAHILHMVTDATGYRLFGLDYFDSVILSGDYQKKDIRELERRRGLKEKELFTAGCTYLDALAEKLAASPPGPDPEKPAAPKTVLLAPSWGKNGILSRYGLSILEPLARSSYRLIIRPHPQSFAVEKALLDKLRSALSAYTNVEWNSDAENLAALSRADLLISDFSGVIFDYAFLFKRPVLYPRFDFDRRPYDAADIEDELWTFKALGAIGTPVEENDFAGIEKIIDRELAEGKERGEITLKLKDEAWQYRGEAGKRTVDFLCGILGGGPGERVPPAGYGAEPR